MSEIAAVTVYCSSSRRLPQVYVDAAAALGRAIAAAGWTLVYGGNRIGCMGTLADAARAAKGKVVGITPRLFIDKGLGDERCDELVLTDTMRQRKELLEQRGDAFIALPGGIGTLEEVFEILVGRSLEYHHKPIVLLNVAGYYDPLLEMMRQGLRQGFIREGTDALWQVAASVEGAVVYLKSVKITPPPPRPPLKPVPSAIE